MKITIPTPCKEKLQHDNFCATCQHKITDFSRLSNDEISKEFKENDIHCGIFNSRQLEKNILRKTIFNAIIFSTIGLLTSCTDAQEAKTFCHDNSKSIDDSIQKEKIKFKIIVNSGSSNSEIKTYRLLINDELIESKLNVDEEYTIQFETVKNTELHLRLASNEVNSEVYTSYSLKKFPKKVNLNTSDFEEQMIIMGEIVIHENFVPEK